MPRAAAALLALSLLACGGGDDGDDGGRGGGADGTAAVSAEPVGALVRSDDGRAELQLPPGADAARVTVEPLVAEGRVLAYELGPSGTSFDEPAILTISDVEPPSPGALAIAYVVDDGGDVELVDVETAIGEPDGPVAVTVTVPHFSEVWITWESGGFEGSDRRETVGAVELRGPRAVVPDEPFEVTASISLDLRKLSLYGWPPGSEQRLRRGEVVPATLDEEIELATVRVSGSLAAGNARPASITELPASTVLEHRLEPAATLRCTATGRVDLRYRARVEIDYRHMVRGKERTGTFRTSVRTRQVIPCNAAGATSTTTFTAADKPVVAEIRLTLTRPVTTYTIVATDPNEGDLTYVWRMVGEDCGSPTTPWTQHGQIVSWSHADDPPDSCSHGVTDHDVQVSVTITSELGAAVTCSFEGSETRLITGPACV